MFAYFEDICFMISYISHFEMSNIPFPLFTLGKVSRIFFTSSICKKSAYYSVDYLSPSWFTFPLSMIKAPYYYWLESKTFRQNQKYLRVQNLNLYLFRFFGEKWRIWFCEIWRNKIINQNSKDEEIHVWMDVWKFQTE